MTATARRGATTGGHVQVVDAWRSKLVLTVDETAEVLGVSRHTVQRRIKDGQIPVVRYGRCPRVPVQALVESIDRQTTGGVDAVLAPPSEVSTSYSDGGASSAARLVARGTESPSPRGPENAALGQVAAGLAAETERRAS